MVTHKLNPPIDPHLIFENSSLKIKFYELDFYSDPRTTAQSRFSKTLLLQCLLLLQKWQNDGI